MRPHTERLAHLLAGPGVTVSTRAESWYGGDLLHEGIPVESGAVVWTADVIDTADVALSVPYSTEFDLPVTENPLGAYGQRVRLLYEVATPSGDVETTPLGWFRIEPSETSGGVLQLDARDLTLEIERARLVTPVQLTFPTSTNPATQTFDPAAAIKHLVNGVLPVAVLDNLDDLAGALYASRDRRQAVEDILLACSGTAGVDVSGAFVVTTVPDLSDPEPVLTFTDQADGTVTELRPEVDASRGFNACIVQGVTAEGAPVYGGAFVTDGPMAWPVQDGVVSPYGANPGFFFSPLLRTVAACTAAAQSMLSRWVLGAAGTFTVEAAPDPRLEINDVVLVVSRGVERVGIVQELRLPLTATSGSMTFTGALL